MFVGKTVTYKGKVWCSVPDAALYLGIKQQKVRDMMGDRLDYVQIRKNRQPYVGFEDVMKLQLVLVRSGKSKLLRRR